MCKNEYMPIQRKLWQKTKRKKKYLDIFKTKYISACLINKNIFFKCLEN